MMRVVLDSNVYVSAFHFGGTPEQILRHAEGGIFELCVSQFIAAEVTRVLTRKFGWTEEDVSEALGPILEISRLVKPKRTVSIVHDADDNRILECALEADARVIVTGDDHLLRLRVFQGIQIVSPRAFLNWLVY
jgi:hypothetical protein